MSNPRNALSSLLHSRGVAGPARVRPTTGTGAPKTNRASRLWTRATVLLTTVIYVGSFTPGAAQAATSHEKIGEFTGVEVPGGKLGDADGVAVDAASGDVYVADIEKNVVDKFTAAGKYICQISGATIPSATECDGIAGSATPAGSFAFAEPAAVAVDNSSGPSAGDVYVVDAGHEVLDRFSAAGAFLGTVGGPYGGSLYGVSVDANGNVWVDDLSGTVHEFDSSGNPVFQFSSLVNGKGAPTPGFAVDSNGNSYIVTLQGVNKFNGAGEYLGFADECAKSFCEGGVATDLSSDEVYVLFEGGHEELSPPHVAEYAPSKIPLVEFGQSQLASGGMGALAVNPVTGTIYVANAIDGKVYIYGRTPGPRVAPQAASNVQTTTATLSATVNPEGLATTYRFEYGTSIAYGQSAPMPPAGAGSGTSPVAASVGLTSLQGGTTYHYRLAATNANGTVFGADRTFTTSPVAVIDSVSVTKLGRTSATLNAQIDPQGLQVTECHFEYGTSGPYEHSVPCVPAAAAIPADSREHAVSAAIPGPGMPPLEESKIYHWRIVVADADGAAAGSSTDHTFVYGTAGSELPDHRAYEMVTPPQKNGALINDVNLIGAPPDIADDGSRVITQATQCFAGAQACVAVRDRIGSPYAFTRTSSGWQTTPLAPPATQLAAEITWNYNATEGTVLFSGPSRPGGEDDFYLHPSEGPLSLVGPVTPPQAGGEMGSPLNGQYSSVGFTHLVWEQSADARWPFDTTVIEDARSGYALYEYPGIGRSQPLLVAVSGGSGSDELISKCGSNASPVPGPLSEDGRIFYFSAKGGETASGECTGSGANNENTPVPVQELFARVDNSEADARTVAISEPQAPQIPGGPGPRSECMTSTCIENTESPTPPATNPNWRDAVLAGSSADGSKVFFTSTQQLTDTASQDSRALDGGEVAGSPAGCSQTVGPNGCNLYEYECAGCAHASERHLIDVSAGDSSGDGPRVRGVVAVSADGTHVYFVAQGVLTSAPNGQGQSAQDGADNFYVYERDAAHPDGELTFVAGLPASDEEQWVRGPGLEANVTPDGRYLVFLSRGRLTPDDTSVSGALQVFRYDADQTEQEVREGIPPLVRLSIGNDGFDDNGNRSAPTPCITSFCSEDASIVPAHRFTYLGPWRRRDPTMSDDGERVFFRSPVGLTPQALDHVQIGTVENGNGLPEYAQNVYEWEAGGAGSCGQASGCVYLISDGRDATRNKGTSVICTPSLSSVCLLGTDTEGKNVFFTTADQLVPQDTDTELDIYDARVCEPEHGNPCIVAPAPPPLPCQGEACHGTPPATPSLLAPGSATFNGQGNITPTPAVTPKSLTKTQKLASALRICRKDKKKAKRKACEASAHKKYGPVKQQKAKKSSHDRRTSR